MRLTQKDLKLRINMLEKLFEIFPKEMVREILKNESM